MTYTYTTTSGTLSIFGQVNNEKVNITTGIIPITGLDGNASNNELISFSSPTRTILLKGVYVDSSIANLKTNFVDKWSAVTINGNFTGQENGMLTSDLSGNFSGKIMAFEYEYKEGEVLSLTYSVTFAQGK